MIDRGGVRRAAVSLLLALSLAPAGLAMGAEEDDEHGGITIDLDVTAFSNDNLTLAERDRDIAKDSGVEAAVTWSHTDPPLEGSATGWSLGAKTVKFEDFEDLDRLELKAEGRYVAQFRRGFSAPIYELNASAKLIDSVSDIRDGWEIAAGAMMTRRLTTALTGRMGLRATRREADEFRAFDNKRINLFFNGDLQVARQTVLYGTYIASGGDVVATAQPTFKVVDAAEVIEPDDAFGGLESNRFAYRLDATVHIVTVGWNQTLGPSTSLDISLQGLTAHADGDNDYERGIARLSFLHRF